MFFTQEYNLATSETSMPTGLCSPAHLSWAGSLGGRHKEPIFSAPSCPRGYILKTKHQSFYKPFKHFVLINLNTVLDLFPA